MFKKIVFPALLIIFLSSVAYSQNITVSGFVTDIKTNEKIIGVSVYDNEGNGTVSNEYGFFSIKINKGISLSFSNLSYKTKTIQINTKKDTVINILLTSNENDLGEVIITSQKNSILQTQSNLIIPDLKSIKKLPAIGGETDIIRSLQLFPGIQSGNEGTTGLYIRGGGSDQNLFLLDGVPLYNISHLFGFMSVFNDDAVNSMKVIKGGFPAQYGGRLSSVVDVRLKEGNMNNFSGILSLGLISSKLMFEGPVKKGKSSFLISARRTYIDAILNSINFFTNSEDDIDKTNYNFYDITGKINYKFSDKNRLYLSLYSGKDNFINQSSYKDNEINSNYLNGLNWGSNLICLRHIYVFSKNVFLNTSLYYSKYKLINHSSSSFINNSNSLENSFYEINYSSDIKDFGIISNLDIYKSANYKIKTGINGIRHYFLPGIKTTKNENGSSASQTDSSDGTIIPANEFRAYIENEINLSSKLKLNAGINASMFEVKDTNYFSVEPRLAGAYILSENSSIKASYSEMQQYLHLLTNAGFGLPTDLWVPPTSVVKPQKAEQYTLGYYKKLPFNILLSFEIYFKNLKNLITYKDNTSFFIESKNWDTKILNNGKGKSYGFELFFQKNTEKMQIRLAYTLSKTTRQFAELNGGKEYPYKYDRRHDISISFIYKLNKNINISGNWVFGTGNAVTIPVAVYPSIMYPPSLNSFESEDSQNYLPVSNINYRNNTEIFDYGERNSQRMPTYHRLDLNISFKKKKKNGEQLFSLGLYNAYSRRNPYYLIYSYSSDAFGDYNAKGEFRTVSLFPVLPSVSYSFKF